jgi:mRNA interferase HigB
VHIITRKRLNEFAHIHPDSLTALSHWYREMKSRHFTNFAQLREIFPSADQVDNKTVFNIGGNKYRLIAVIHYNRARVYIRAILSHRDYDKGAWKNQ